jgi:hypothetical protein
MAITAFPRPGETVSTDQYRNLFRQFVSTGATTSTALTPYGDSSGLNVKIVAGSAVIDGVFVDSPDLEQRGIAAGSGGGLSRVDLLVANLDFSATPVVSFTVLQGTPAATNATAPSMALTGTIVFRWALASINVSPTASTILAGDVVDLRTFSGDPRLRIQEEAPTNAPLNTIHVW